METETQGGGHVHDVELPQGCAGCGGSLSARFTPSSGRAVCLSCHVLSEMMLVRTGQTVRIVPTPMGLA